MQKIRKAVVPRQAGHPRAAATKAMPKRCPIVESCHQYIVRRPSPPQRGDPHHHRRGKGIMEDHLDRAPEL